MGDPSNPSQIKEPKSIGGGRSIKPNSCDSKQRRDLHEHEEESPGSVADGLFGIAKALDDGRDESGVKVEFEVVTGEHGGEVQRLECALGDSKVVVQGETCWEERGKLNKISIKILAFSSVRFHI